MEANQITVRLSNEEYVRGVWDFGRVGIYGYGGTAKYLNFSLIGKEVMGANEAQMWELAAEYTRKRLEQVRQLREEIHRMECLLMPPPRVLIREAVEEMWPGDMALEYVREVCAYSRTIARLEAELATLTRGMKPEALEGATR